MTSSTWILSILFSVFLPLSATAPPQGEVAGKLEELTTKAKEAYSNGKPKDAVNYLQQAIGAIQEEGVQGLATFTPIIPKNWKADEAKTTTGMWGGVGGTAASSFQWSNVTRKYVRESDGLKMDVTISNWPQIITAQRASIQMIKSNPMFAQMMNQDPNKKMTIIDQDGWIGMRQIQKGRRAEIMVMGKSTMVMLKLSKDDEAALDLFWKSMRLKELTKLDASTDQ